MKPVWKRKAQWRFLLCIVWKSSVRKREERQKKKASVKSFCQIWKPVLSPPTPPPTINNKQNQNKNKKRFVRNHVHVHNHHIRSELNRMRAFWQTTSSLKRILTTTATTTRNTQPYLNNLWNLLWENVKELNVWWDSCSFFILSKQSQSVEKKQWNNLK